MLMAFYPGVKIVEDAARMDEVELEMHVCYSESETRLTVCRKGENCDMPEHFRQVEELPLYKDRLLFSTGGNQAKLLANYQEKAQFRNLLKIASYRLLRQFTGKTLPWGDLTGVRPTKIAMTKLTEEQLTSDEVVHYYKSVYDVSEQKARLAVTVAENEHRLVKGIDLDTDYCLYVGIPFCPSRCLYCSFTSYPIQVYADKAKLYIQKLCEELQFIAEKYRNKRLVAIYIGGGTPTSISHELLGCLLQEIQTVFRLKAPEVAAALREFTVEAGRPDSITMEKLAVMKQYGVTRISINPQTMNDATLRTIGRAHDSEQVRQAFSMARQAGFDNINMDLIAGLPGENLDSMRHTLDAVRTLAPESLTVHSLAIKRAANLRQQMDTYGTSINQDMDAMHMCVSEAAQEFGMEPYYMYRQKNIGGNLENVGYAKPGCECLYNILIMEEMTDIIAAGAGASTKFVYHAENRVERVENCKSVDDYIGRFEEMLARKQDTK